MPVEFINVLVQVGIAGIFIWYLREQLDKRDTMIDQLYQKIEAVQREERNRADILCKEYQDKIAMLREDRDRQLRERITDKAKQEQLLWQIGESLGELAEAELRRRQAGRNNPDDPGVGA